MIAYCRLHNVGYLNAGYNSATISTSWREMQRPDQQFKSLPQPRDLIDDVGIRAWLARPRSPPSATMADRSDRIRVPVGSNDLLKAVA